MNPHDSSYDLDLPDDQPLDLVPDDDEHERPLYRIHHKPQAPTAQPSNQETKLDETVAAQSAPRTNGALPEGPVNSITQALRWALDSMHEPAIAAADWLARDIDPQARSAAEFLANPNISLTHVRQAKSVFKTMRIVGEKSADRRVGARMYAAAIAAALVRHGKRISTQSDAALKRGFTSLLEDRKMPQPLRELGGLGLCALQNEKGLDTETNPLRSKSA